MACKPQPTCELSLLGWRQQQGPREARPHARTCTRTCSCAQCCCMRCTSRASCCASASCRCRTAATWASSEPLTSLAISCWRRTSCSCLLWSHRNDAEAGAIKACSVQPCLRSVGGLVCKQAFTLGVLPTGGAPLTWSACAGAQLRAGCHTCGAPPPPTCAGPASLAPACSAQHIHALLMPGACMLGSHMTTS